MIASDTLRIVIYQNGMTQWYYSSNGQQQGPVPIDQLNEKITAGEVGPEDLAWNDTMTDWLPVSKIAELAGPMAPASSASGPPLAGESPSTATPETAPIPSPYQAPGPSVATTPDPTPEKPLTNYLWQSIVATLLCCLPLGVVAIVYAAKVDGLKNSGDLAAARAASNSAKLWVNLSAGSILIIVVVSIILNLLGVADASSTG